MIWYILVWVWIIYEVITAPIMSDDGGLEELENKIKK